TWIHTHPGISAFFSGTDVETFSYLTKMNPKLTAVVIDPLKKKDIVSLNSKTGNSYSFTEIPFLIKKTPENKRNGRLYEAIQEEIIKPYYGKIMKTTDKIHVFTPIDEYECLANIIKSRYNQLERKHKVSEEKTLLKASLQIDTKALMTQLPQIGIDPITTPIISSFLLSTRGIVIHQLNIQKPKIEFLAWSKIRKVSILYHESYFILMQITIQKFLRNRSEKLLFVTQQPTELLNIFTRYCGLIEIEKKRKLENKKLKQKKIKEEKAEKYETKEEKTEEDEIKEEKALSEKEKKKDSIIEKTTEQDK
ncbi:MAG: hypothetical protein ACXAC7_17875, partial [Candidatus Hodarchaeales archaeon]